MKKIIIIRAGSPAWKEQNRLQGTLPLPISEAGKEVLDQISSFLKEEGIDCLYSSGNESSGPTAQYLSHQFGFKTKKHTGLRELNCGLWQGLCLQDIQKRFGTSYKQWKQDPTAFTPPQGESTLAAYDRIREAVRQIIRKSGKKKVAVIVGRMAAAMIECHLTQKDVNALWQVAAQEAPLKVLECQSRIAAGPYEVYVPNLQVATPPQSKPAAAKRIKNEIEEEDPGQSFQFEAGIA